MNFGQAVQSCLNQYLGFSGRARRSEYWWFALFDVIVSVVVAGIDAAVHMPLLGIVVTVGLILPGLASASDACTTPTGPRGGS